jgi:general secretion pathway protein A
MDANPFTTTALPEGLYVTESLAATLAKVRYVVDRRQGLTVIYGDNGTGKTSVLSYLYDEYRARGDTETALLPNPSYKTDVSLLRAISGEFGLPLRRSMLDQEATLRAFLVERHAEGRNAIAFIDEAQVIPGRALELIRLLLNLDTHHAKLLQIVLAGQLELRDRLRDPTKKALRSRIFITSTLDPLTLGEAREMIAYRCRVAARPNPFPDETVEAIWADARGIPREVIKRCALTWEIAEQSGLTSVPPEALAVVAGDIEPV